MSFVWYKKIKASLSKINNSVFLFIGQRKKKSTNNKASIKIEKCYGKTAWYEWQYTAKINRDQPQDWKQDNHGKLYISTQDKSAMHMYNHT